MQVGPFCAHAAASAQSRTVEAVLGGRLGGPAALIPSETKEWRERVRCDEMREEQAAATLVPTRSTDVIRAAERAMAPGSRALRRQVTREQATEQFREQRQAFRRAFAEAKNPKGATRCQTQVFKPAEHRSQAGTQSQPDTKATSKPPPVEPRIREPGTSARGRQPPAKTGPGRGPAPGPGSAATPAPRTDTSRLMRAGALKTKVDEARGVQRGPAMTRPAPRAPLRSGRPPVDGAAKPVGRTAAMVSNVRATLRPSDSASRGFRSQASAQAEARQANTERIVRVVRNQIGAKRSHTVMRLEPPELGSLRLQLHLHGNTLALEVDTTTEVAHRLLSEDLGRLREGLEAAGVQLERVEIRPPAAAPESAEQGLAQHAGSDADREGGSTQSDAEDSQHPGGESHHATGTEDERARGVPTEPAAESPVNLVA